MGAEEADEHAQGFGTKAVDSGPSRAAVARQMERNGTAGGGSALGCAALRICGRPTDIASHRMGSAVEYNSNKQRAQCTTRALIASLANQSCD